MSSQSIVKSITVKATPSRAFDIFTGQMGRWWGVGETMGKAPHRDMVVEPRQGGKWFEIDATGAEIRWGTVRAWEPGSRLLLDWQVNSQFKFDPGFSTDLEITFVPAAAGGTLVTLEHRNLERFGADAAKFAGMLDGGWERHLAQIEAFIAAGA